MLASSPDLPLLAREIIIKKLRSRKAWENLSREGRKEVERTFIIKIGAWAVSIQGKALPTHLCQLRYIWSTSMVPRQVISSSFQKQ